MVVRFAHDELSPKCVREAPGFSRGEVRASVNGSATGVGRGCVGAGRYVAVVIETVRYTYRLRPGAQAEVALLAEWNRCRFLWNEAVHQQKTGQRPTFTGLCRLLTEARGQFVWLREGSQVDLSMRTFRCVDCGFTAEADLNAARVILATGERIRAGADDVRHSLPPSGAVVVRSEPEIPRRSAVGNR